MKKILIIGTQGQVAWELIRTIAPLGQVVSLGRLGNVSLDLSQPDSIEKTITDTNPDIIINAAAYTAVDKAEQESQEAHLINAVAPGMLSEAAKKVGAKLVHYSTDYVFDGMGQTPYLETDATSPQGIYGASKLAGEKAIKEVDGDHLIFRTAWVYGNRGQNFMRTMRRIARDREELKVVADQQGAPTWSRHIAEATALTLAQLKSDDDWKERRGIYHLTSGGVASWYDFAKAIIEHQAQYENIPCKKITPITTADFPTPAKRPQWSVLDNSKIEKHFGIKLPDWRDALKQVQVEIPLYQNV